MSYIGGNTNPGNYIGNHPVAGYASSLPNFRNRIINGNFDVWQRDTSFTITNSTNTYSADRWRFIGTNFTGTLTQENFNAGQTDVPNSPDYFAKWTVTTNPSGNMAFGQYIENVRTLAGKTATLSLYLKSSSTISANTLQIRYRQFTGGTGGSNTSTNIGEITTSWQKFTFQLDIPSLTGATLGANNSSYLSVEILSPSGHTSSFDLSIAQVQLEEGTVATPFEHRPIGLELGLCQRYYFKTFNQATAPAQGVNSEGALGGSSAVGNVSFTSTMKLPVSMRTKPNPIITYSTTNANENWSDQSGLKPTASVLFAGENSISVRATTSIAAGGAHSIHITAEAEL